MNSGFFPGARLVFALLLILPMRSQDVSGVSFYRSASYQQVGNTAPEPIPETPDESPFFALAVMDMSGDFLSDPDNLLFVRAVTLQPPTGSLRPMEFMEEFGGFVFFQTFTSLSALESAFRAGTYTFTYGSLISGDADFLLGVNETMLPAPAQVVDFVAAQNINPEQAFLLQWSPEAPAVGGVQLEIYDLADGSFVFDSEPQLGALSSLEIPAGTLQAGHSYEAEISFTRFDNEDGSTASSTLTRVSLATGTGSVAAPVINSIALNDADEVVLVINCTPGVPLNVQQSGSLGGGWEIVKTVTPDASPFTVELLATQLPSVAFLQATQ